MILKNKKTLKFTHQFIFNSKNMYKAINSQLPDNILKLVFKIDGGHSLMEAVIFKPSLCPHYTTNCLLMWSNDRKQCGTKKYVCL